MMQKSHVIILLTTTTTTLVTAVGVYLYKKYWSIPSKWTPVGKVTKLCMFPLKSGRRNEVEKAECLQRGLVEVDKFDDRIRLLDRSFVVYNTDNFEHRTARHYPKLVLIEVHSNDSNSVRFNAPGMETLILRVPNRSQMKVISVKHHRTEEIESIECGEEAARWISRYILEKDSGLGLVYHDGSFGRPNAEIVSRTQKIPYYDRGLKNEYTGFNTDIAAVFMVNQVSVDKMAEQMEGEKVDVNYFRPNIVVNGPNLKPFEEYDWEWIKVGDVVMKNVGECVRCILTLVNMETGERRDDRQPLKILEKISTHPKKLPIMGIYTNVLRTGIINRGDTVYIGKR